MDCLNVNAIELWKTCTYFRLIREDIDADLARILKYREKSELFALMVSLLRTALEKGVGDGVSPSVDDASAMDDTGDASGYTGVCSIIDGAEILLACWNALGCLSRPRYCDKFSALQK